MDTEDNITQEQTAALAVPVKSFRLNSGCKSGFLVCVFDDVELVAARIGATPSDIEVINSELSRRSNTPGAIRAMDVEED